MRPMIWVLVLGLTLHVSSSCTAPTSFSYSTASTSTITITWDNPGGADSFDFQSNVDGDIPHTGLSSPTYTYTGLTAGLEIEMTGRVDASCSGTAADPFISTLDVNTVPDMPVIEKNMDEETEANFVFTQAGAADSYKISSALENVVRTEASYYASGMSEGKTYTFEVKATLGGYDSDPGTITHSVPGGETILGLDPWLFCFLLIGFMILVVIIIIVIIVVVCLCIRRMKKKREERGHKGRRDKDGKLMDDDSETGTGEEQAWEYKDPYETADYRLTNTQKKRAFAIAAQKAALTNNTNY